MFRLGASSATVNAWATYLFLCGAKGQIRNQLAQGPLYVRDEICWTAGLWTTVWSKAGSVQLVEVFPHLGLSH